MTDKDEIIRVHMKNIRKLESENRILRYDLQEAQEMVAYLRELIDEVKSELKRMKK